MNKQDRKILNLTTQYLSLDEVFNPCDIKSIIRNYKELHKRIDFVKEMFNELSCYDVPEYIINEYEEQLIQLTSPNKDYGSESEKDSTPKGKDC